MNAEQHNFLQEHNLSVDMTLALSSLIDGSKMRYHNRSYKALQRRGLATEDFLVTPDGESVYKAYCQLGPTVLEMNIIRLCI